jgi:cation diffusion facilitator CzcD-associated flavoprotein CzcO
MGEFITPSEMSNGTNGVNGLDGQGQHYDYPPTHVDGPYKILDQYHSKPTKLRVACAGAGASGLCLAYKMEKMLEAGSWELTLYEKNPQFGGTWYENTYPGVACDIPSHDYNFTWDPKPDWTHFFAAGKEIQGYFEGFAERHGKSLSIRAEIQAADNMLGSKRYMQLNSKITEANWNNDDGCWNLTIRNPKTGAMRKDWAHVFVNGTGEMNPFIVR